MKRPTFRASSAKKLLMLASSLLVGCSPPEVSETENEEATGSEAVDRVALTEDALSSLELSYARAERMTLTSPLELPAEIVPVPDRLASIGARVSGRVVEILVNVGDLVDRSDPLVVIESAEVGRAWADLVAGRAGERVARRELDRQTELLNGRVISVQAFEEAQSVWEIAEAEVRAAETRLLSLGVSNPGSRPENPALVTLYSPISGTVTARTASLGEWVQPSSALLRIVDLTEVWLEASVHEREVRFVEVGLDVQVELRAFPDDVFIGVVERIGGELDEATRSMDVRIALSNQEGRLRPGMFATARLRGSLPGEGRELIAIPWAAVQEIDGRPAVFVRLEDDAFEVRRVHTAERVGAYVEILTGLEVGDEVVADGSLLLKAQLLRSELAEEEEG